MNPIRYDWTLFNQRPAGPITLLPRVEVDEDGQRYVLRADLPGVTPQDIELTTEAGVLTLKAERRGTLAGSTAITLQRRFTLPEDADLDAISARSSHGVLEITIDKLAKVQPRRISVQAA